MHLYGVDAAGFDTEATNEDASYNNYFMPIEKVAKAVFAERWRQIPDKFRHKLAMGKLYSKNESAVIRRLQAHNVMGTNLKSSGAKTIMYFAGKNSDGLIFLIELCLERYTNQKDTELFGTLTYKTETLARDPDFEEFMIVLLSKHGEANFLETLCGR
mmetsp:Transcript_43092/g.49521  ORF Transcript_43092/g.49521 Transcript_43092/m.49521 type:complete len:158 (+) Transcript_43092:348-821(+)|eukprot:CAMPEP_0114987818 /NCGR_PEP_ID=MMETSP0216-20121206/9233_1 /TAXON_ID=223996 /ORGANISM="Protocruzia adherens, Strain Boccale" /LENGTH=157 /DNA_ID=CAMNT_0002350487 /DNA_START=415 /DNA_END=888 /DNA_ORIENTATION=+